MTNRMSVLINHHIILARIHSITRATLTERLQAARFKAKASVLLLFLISRCLGAKVVSKAGKQRIIAYYKMREFLVNIHSLLHQKFQFVQCSSTKFFNCVTGVLLNISACPFVCWYLSAVVIGFIWFETHSATQNLVHKLGTAVR